ncbi:sugar ABC transporter substrate-binding protein [Brenneria roseae subsp. americana]|uniref:Sugar ABC transporter substrate-binding protein n=1 Tax=Brenneria roseae subsp. americana TaxID=1508507 RepID=A0A2U1U2G7_9GAMM|nr:sugar ABC transporter substrate-binding protein [Brenneria roseae subsp. americana]
MKIKMMPLCFAVSFSLFSTFGVHAETKELRFSWWGGNQRHQATSLAIAEFEKAHPDIKVRSEPAGWDGYLSKLTTQLAGNNEPDVMQTNWNWMVLFSKDGNGFYDIGKVAAQIDLTQFSDQAKKMVTMEGKLNAVPVAMTGRSMYYNPELWQKVGLAYPKTWDEMIAAGPIFKQKLGDDYYPFLLANHDTTIMTFLNSYMIQKYNKTMIDEKNQTFAFTPQEWQEYFGLYKKLVDNHVIPSMKFFAAYGKANAWEIPHWLGGKIGGVHTWSTDNTFSSSLKAPATLEVGPYPMLAGAHDSGIFFKPAMMFSIGKNTRYPQEAAQLIDFMLNSPEGVKAMELQRGVPLSQAAVAQLMADGTINPDQLPVQGLKQVESLYGDIPPSPYMENPQLLAAFLEHLQKYDYGQMTLEEVAQSFPRSGARILKRIM